MEIKDTRIIWNAINDLTNAARLISQAACQDEEIQTILNPTIITINVAIKLYANQLRGSGESSKS